jgi:hypothetical protein
MDGDFLQVTNDDVKTWDFRWSRKHYVVPPNEQGFVPFEALVNSLGDPRSMENQIVKYSDGDGNKGIVMDRYNEITRLFAMYSVQNENLDELVDKAPKVTVRTLHGQMVRFPTQKPDMLPFPVTFIDEHSVNSDTMQITDRLAAENNEFRERIADLESKLDRAIQTREGVDEETEE